jgi:hypothetical protein
VGVSWGEVCEGGSGVYFKGKLIKRLDDKEGILIFDTKDLV